MRQIVLSGMGQTFSRRAVEYKEVKVGGFAKVIGEDDFFFKIKHRDTGAIEGHLRLFPLRLELVKDGRGHMAQISIRNNLLKRYNNKFEEMKRCLCDQVVSRQRRSSGCCNTQSLRQPSS